MYSVWTKHAKDPEDKIQLEKSIRHSKWILEHLDEILQGMENSLSNTEISPMSYDTRNWAYRQAHANGFRQCLRSVRKIINLDQKDFNDRLTPATDRPTDTGSN